MPEFEIVSKMTPKGDQPAAIEQLTARILAGERYSTLLGVTGSGKTFTMANVIASQNRPTLVLAPNKTLAAQLWSEMKTFFPENAVEYFVSYYDYYQPEAYVPRTDTFIEKDSSINEQIDRMRHSATRALMERDDVIIVASVSCIYRIGPFQQRLGGRQPHLLDMLVDRRVLLDEQVSRRHVGFRLIVVVIRHEVLDGVLREEALHLAVELGRQGLVGRHHQRRPPLRGDDVGHGEGLARASDAQQHLVALAAFDAGDELADRLGLVAGRRVIRHHLVGLWRHALELGPPLDVRHVERHRGQREIL